MQEHQIEWTRVKNDVNGNPRYVCHFTNLETFNTRFHARVNMTISDRYARAVKWANKLGGRKFHNKSFGGGIVFTAYDCELPRIVARIHAMQESK
jgi:hypothetical protein